MKNLLSIIIITLPLLGWTQSAFQEDLHALVTANSEKVISLAEAIPEENYTWSPSDGVRNVKNVVLHIAGANYFFPSVMGGQIPEGIDPRSFEASIEDKETTITTLKESYGFMLNFISEMPAEKLDEKMEFFGREMSVRALLMGAFGHCEEHMGQLIAYARSNNVTPPWSQ